MFQKSKKILCVQSSPRGDESESRQLVNLLAEGLSSKSAGAEIVQRDVGLAPPSPVDQSWIGAAYTPPEMLNDAQRGALTESNGLVDEFLEADAVVIGAPVHNFTISAGLKLWIDQVARAGRTFKFSETGSEPLGPDRPTFVVVSGAGVPFGSEIDFNSSYLRLALPFLGLMAPQFINATELITKREERIREAHAQIAQIVFDSTL